jgi:hypothetical protein
MFSLDVPVRVDEGEVAEFGLRSVFQIATMILPKNTSGKATWVSDPPRMI